VPYLLDTNIVIHVRDGSAIVLERFAEHRGDIFISALNLAELQRGLYGKPPSTELALSRIKLDAILRDIVVLPFDWEAALAYGRIIGERGWVRGRDTDRNRMIAAHAISSQSVLVTDNLADFRDIAGLTIENWTIAR